MTAIIQWLSDRWTAPQGLWVGECCQLIPQSIGYCVRFGKVLLHAVLAVVAGIFIARSEPQFNMGCHNTNVPAQQLSSPPS